MGHRVIHQPVDDITGQDVPHVTKFAWQLDDASYALEIGPDTAEEVRRYLAPFVTRARELATQNIEPLISNDLDDDVFQAESEDSGQDVDESEPPEPVAPAEKVSREAPPAAYGNKLCPADASREIREWWLANEANLGVPYGGSGRIPTVIHAAYHEHGDGGRRVRGNWRGKVGAS